MAHFDHLIWPTWVVILCIISPGFGFDGVLREIHARRSRGGGNVGIAAAISKGCGKGGKTVLSFSHAFLRPSFPRPLLIVPKPVQRFLLLSSVRRKRNDSVPVSMMCARSVIRSSSALQSRGFGNTVVHSENGKFVVTIIAARLLGDEPF